MPSRLAWTLVILATLTANLAFAVPAPWNKVKEDSYTGAAGQAPGGSIADGTPNDNGLYNGLLGLPPILNLGSQNAGMGGDASSGSAVVNRRSERSHGPEKFPQTDNGSSFTGVGGDAKGGEFQGEPGIINLFSTNAGDAGTANSGSSGVLGGLPGIL